MSENGYFANMQSKKKYRKKTSKETVVETVAIDHLNFTIESGSFISIMGKSGCGKTTLLKFIMYTLVKTRNQKYLDKSPFAF